MIPTQYVCSEIAVEKILRSVGVRIPNMIQKLKHCETLEQMKPCVLPIVENTKISCDFMPMGWDDIQRKASKEHPVAIRIRQVVQGRPLLHTINIVGYSPPGETEKYGHYIVDEENNTLHAIMEKELEGKREGVSAFSCQRGDE